MKKFLYFLLSLVIVGLIAVNAFFYYENTFMKSYMPTNNEIKNTKKPVEFKNTTPKKNNSASNEAKNIKPEEKKANLLFTGDVFLNGYILNSYYNQDTQSYSFDEQIFKSVYEISYSDAAFFKFDSVLAGDEFGVSSYEKYNAPSEFAKFMKNIGFKNVILSSQHIFDKKKDGLITTIENFKKNNINIFGTNTNKDEAKSKVLEINGLRIGIATFSREFKTVYLDAYSDYKDYISTLDKTVIKNEIEYLKSLNCDVIIAYVNWGVEHTTKPNYQQLEYAKELIKNGVNIIIGSHPHAIHPVEKLKVEDDNHVVHEGVVFYSLGNFFCDQLVILPYNRFGLVANINIKKVEDNVTIKYNIIPTFIYRTKRTNSSYYDYYILNANEIINRNDIRKSYINYAKKLIEQIKAWEQQIN
ncbi:CapA family protein [Caldicellulosiruptoraceae bacterium PP1]